MEAVWEQLEDAQCILDIWPGAEDLDQRRPGADEHRVRVAHRLAAEYERHLICGTSKQAPHCATKLAHLAR
eukprot:6079485-Prymnesium_polylepis.1